MKALCKISNNLLIVIELKIDGTIYPCLWSVCGMDHQKPPPSFLVLSLLSSEHTAQGFLLVAGGTTQTLELYEYVLISSVDLMFIVGKCEGR